METLKFRLFVVFAILGVASCTTIIEEKDQIYFEKLNDTLIVREKGNFDSLGKKVGKWVGYLANDTIGYIGYYKEDAKDSGWKFFNPMGKIQKEENYVKGLKNGYTRIYSDGKLYDEVEFKGNKKSGRHTHYFSSGRVNFYQEYKDGFFDGDFVAFFEDGKIKQKGRFSHGRCVGEWLLCYPNGTVKEKTIYDSLSPKFREIKYGLHGEIVSDEIK